MSTTEERAEVHLANWIGGDPSALDPLISVIYQPLLQIAKSITGTGNDIGGFHPEDLVALFCEKLEPEEVFTSMDSFYGIAHYRMKLRFKDQLRKKKKLQGKQFIPIHELLEEGARHES